MLRWRDRFDQNGLEQGRKLFEENAVTKIAGNNGKYTAFVMDERGYSVYCSIRDGKVSRMSCTCPQSTQGFSCAHKAALMFAVENELKEMDFVPAEDVEELPPDQYEYFRLHQIKRMIAISDATKSKGEKLFAEKRVVIKSVENTYPHMGEGVYLETRGTCLDQETEFHVGIRMTRNRIEEMACSCERCNPYGENEVWLKPEGRVCAYKYAFWLAIEDYLKKYPVTDATDAFGNTFLHSFLDRRLGELRAEAAATKEMIELEPKLLIYPEHLEVSFRIGSGKMYVVKNLTQLCENLKNEACVSYGKNCQPLLHKIAAFSERSQKLVKLVQQAVMEENLLLKNLSEDPYYVRRPQKEVQGSLELYGWKLDKFYQIMSDTVIESEQPGSGRKEKKSLSCIQKNPMMELLVEPNHLDSTVDFHGVDVSGKIPRLYLGVQNAYFIEEDHLCCSDEEYMKVMESFLRIADGNRRIYFTIGRKNLAAFYEMILPEISKVARVSERYPEEIQKYLSPEPGFTFYLDAENREITCRAEVSYGESTFSMIELLQTPEAEIPIFRNYQREKEILMQLQMLLPRTSEEKELFLCEKKEEAIYRFISEGVDILLSLGEVQTTERFRNLNIAKKAKVSVGVSIVNGLLELDVNSEDLSREELLEVLASYREKKKFHRLRNGDFLMIEEDTYGMLDDLLESLQLSPGEFVKGQMHVPAYRAIYLDKMLQGSEYVYIERDSHFKALVKEFKTVEDAGFVVPESMHGVLKNYQVKGFQWLRTLEANHFGGILADDMGLGKTLQTITVLLSAKEEGKKGTSMIVAPASLVYNWGEEIAHFAPKLKVVLITGTQEERKELIESCEEYDCLVTSYDLLKRDIDLYENKQFLYEIIDEAQYIKNHTTEAAKAVKVINSQQRFALTGTPVENRLSELWSIFDYLMPGFLFSYETFKTRLEAPIVKQQDQNMMQRLKKMVAPFILRRLKENVLKDLPEKMEEVVYAKMGEEQWKLYDAQIIRMQQMVRKQTEKEFHGNKLQMLAQLTKLRQICCDPSLCFEEYDSGSAKRDMCIDLCKRAIEGGHKILLFSQFTSMMALLEEDLQREDISYYMITGATPKEKRQELVKAFNEDETQVFLISLKAGGTGLNLIGADVVIHYDPWWNKAVQNQATDRAHRIGQTKKVTVYQLIAKHSIEEKIVGIQESKKDLADSILSGDVGQLSNMTKEDFLELLSIDK